MNPDMTEERARVDRRLRDLRGVCQVPLVTNHVTQNHLLEAVQIAEEALSALSNAEQERDEARGALANTDRSGRSVVALAESRGETVKILNEHAGESLKRANLAEFLLALMAEVAARHKLVGDLIVSRADLAAMMDKADRATSAEAEAASWKADAASEFLKRQEAEAALKEAVGLLRESFKVVTDRGSGGRMLTPISKAAGLSIRVHTFLAEHFSRQEGESK